MSNKVSVFHLNFLSIFSRSLISFIACFEESFNRMSLFPKMLNLMLYDVLVFLVFVIILCMLVGL